MGNWTRHDTRALIEAAEDQPRMSVGVVRVIRRHHGEEGLVERMALFEDFVRQTHRQPFVWGVSDCSLMVADWCVMNGHPDPAAELRGKYSTEEECRALLEPAGGLSEVVRACAQMAGLKALHEPEFGCVAVIGSRSNPTRQWSAIWNGRRWAVRWHARGETNWTPFVAPVLGMWRV